MKKHKLKQEGFQGQGKGEACYKLGYKAVENRKPSFVRGAAKAQRGEGVGRAGAGGGAVKKGGAKCPHIRQRSKCKQCGGASICEHKHGRSECKQCGGARIGEHNRIRSTCKQCSGSSSICEHNHIKNRRKQCGESSICEHNRIRSVCKQCVRCLSTHARTHTTVHTKCVLGVYVRRVRVLRGTVEGFLDMLTFWPAWKAVSLAVSQETLPGSISPTRQCLKRHCQAVSRQLFGLHGTQEAHSFARR
jgi:hypothetical protein